MNNNEIIFTLLITQVRGSEERVYNVLMEEDGVTIILHPLAYSDKEFSKSYKTVSDVISKLHKQSETHGYFGEMGNDYMRDCKHLIGLMDGTLSMDDMPENIALVGFEGLK